MNNFKDYASYYDLFNAEKNYDQEVDYITDLIRTYQPSSRSILEFGSGTGAHAAALSLKGYEVEGIELSMEMHKIASSKNVMVSHLGDIATYSTGTSHDIVLSMFHVMNYQLTDKQILNVFKNAARHLQSGGLFIFDFWFTPAVYSIGPSCRIKRITDKNVKATRIAQPSFDFLNNIVEVQYDIFVEDIGNGSIIKFDEVHKMRPFGIHELREFASTSGFKLLLTEEFGTKKQLSNETWCGVIVLEKSIDV